MENLKNIANQIANTRWRLGKAFEKLEVSEEITKELKNFEHIEGNLRYEINRIKECLKSLIDEEEEN